MQAFDFKRLTGKRSGAARRHEADVADGMSAITKGGHNNSSNAQLLQHFPPIPDIGFRQNIYIDRSHGRGLITQS